MVKGGAYVYGNYPDIDALFDQQAVELDHGKRAAILTRMQQIVYERAICAPISGSLPSSTASGPRVGEVELRPDRGLPLYRAL